MPVKEVKAADVLADGNTDALLLDVREPGEWHMAHIPGAMHIPLGQLEEKIEAAVPLGRRVVVYCAVGGRSAVAAEVMEEMGYSNVVSMAGGIGAWADAGGPIE